MRILFSFILILTVSSCTSKGNSPQPNDPAVLQTGALSGRIGNLSGGTIQGATIRLIKTNLRATTNSLGKYTISDIPIGADTVTVSASGYQTIKSAVIIKLNEVTSFDVNLAP